MKSPNKKGENKRVNLNERTKCFVKLVFSLYPEENVNLKISKWRKHQVACCIFLMMLAQILEMA